MITNLNTISKVVHQISIDKGWYEEERTFGDIIALCHSELSEALEEFRNGHDYTEVYYNEGSDKPEGIPIEFVDVIIRICDAAARYDIDLDEALVLKAAYNTRRPHKHGGKII